MELALSNHFLSELKARWAIASTVKTAARDSSSRSKSDASLAARRALLATKSQAALSVMWFVQRDLTSSIISLCVVL